jgi:large subunit ribosomal protein L28
MSWVCELTGRKPMVGNNVSHANNRTKRRFLPNLVSVTVSSETLGRDFSLRISTNALRTIDKKGGLDAFLLAAREDKLSVRARRLKREIAKARASA